MRGLLAVFVLLIVTGAALAWGAWASRPADAPRALKQRLADSELRAAALAADHRSLGDRLAAAQERGSLADQAREQIRNDSERAFTGFRAQLAEAQRLTLELRGHLEAERQARLAAERAAVEGRQSGERRLTDVQTDAERRVAQAREETERARREAEATVTVMRAELASREQLRRTEEARAAAPSAGTAVEIATAMGTQGRVQLAGVVFGSNSAELAAPARAALDQAAQYLKANPGVGVHIVGHTDSRGDAAANLALSERRASAVARDLVGRHGIDPRRLAWSGAGDRWPVADNAEDAGRALNRRVEMLLR